jgi:long-chain acyl-CoA synthetase
MGFSIATEELPRTQLKKIKRYLVRQLYLEKEIELEESKEATLSDEERELSQSGIAQKVINFLSKELKRNVNLNSHLEIDLGIDSLSRVELGLGLESLLRVKIPAGLIEKVFTVKELIISLEEISSQAKGTKQAEFTEEKKSWAEIIREKPSDQILAKIKLTSSFLNRLFTFIFKGIFYFLFRTLWLLRIKGKEFIPQDKPYILCPNHASYLDGFLLFSSIPFNSARDLFFVGLAAIFNQPLISWAIKVARLIPIDPATHLTEAMQASAYVLSNKKVLCIFPEGTRSINEEVGDFKKGIGILAKELDVPIIPVYIQGSYYAWPRGSKFPRPYPLKIIFGKPLNWRDMGGDYVAIAKGLREGVLNLRKI